jgi:hypothetical protein
MNSRLRKLLITRGALVTATKRIGSVPERLWYWWYALGGIEKKLRSRHSNVCLGLPSIHTVVAPCPLRMKTVSS